MRKTILYLSGFMIISSLSVSCVSKKKFEELARAKREVDRNLLDLKRDPVDLLTGKLGQTIATSKGRFQYHPVQTD